MIVFVSGVETSGWAGELRDAFVRHGAGRAAAVDAHAFINVSPAYPDGHVRFDAMRRALEAWADLHRSADVLVIGVPDADVRWLPDLAFWVRRRASQRCVWVRAEGGDAEQWAATTVPGLSEPQCVAVRHEQPRIETDRLVLTPPTEAQARDYFRRIVGTRMFDTLMWNGPGRVEDLLDKYLEFEQHNCRGPGSPCVVGIIERSTDRQVGAIGARTHAADPARLELGYSLEMGAHGRGYGTEAIREFVRYLFELRGAERIEAEVFVGNWASRRVLEKNGFKCEVEDSPHRCPKRGERKNEWAFVLTRPMWESLVLF